MIMELYQLEYFIKMINAIHKDFNRWYFTIEEHNHINLKKVYMEVPVDYILKYRLYLHENINDYLMNIDSRVGTFFYRVKTTESINYKIDKKQKEGKYPLNKYLNDIFGCRVLLDTDTIDKIEPLLDELSQLIGFRYYKRDKDGYKGIHVYFKNNNTYFPWELQIWDRKDIENNVISHRIKKRKFL